MGWKRFLSQKLLMHLMGAAVLLIPFSECFINQVKAETLPVETPGKGDAVSSTSPNQSSQNSSSPFHSSIQWSTLEKGNSLDKSLTGAQRPFTMELQSISPLSQFPDLDWWNQFQDPFLSEMIQEAFIANQDLRLATLKLEESQGLARQLLGRELPTLDFQPNFTRQRNSKNLTSFPISQGTGSGPRIFAPGQTIDIYNVPLKASYDLDLWGKKRLTTQAQQKLSKAYIQERKAALVKVATEVSTAYFNLLKADSQLALLKENLALQHDRLALIQSKYDAGLVDYTEIDLAKATLKQLEIQFPQYTQQQEVALHQLAVLIGKSPSVLAGFQRGRMEAISLGEPVPVGIPSELVGRRPDILAAQARLENKKLMTEVSRRDLLPSFPITGQFGFASTKIKQIFNWQSYLAAVGGGLSQTVFDGGAKWTEIKLNKNRYQQSFETYQQTILKAFQEVEDALASLKSHWGQRDLVNQRLLSLQDHLRLVQNQYNEGLVSYLEVNQAIQQLIPVQQSQVDLQASYLLDKLSLYQALGGGY